MPNNLPNIDPAPVFHARARNIPSERTKRPFRDQPARYLGHLQRTPSQRFGKTLTDGEKALFRNTLAML
jgi:hypothetical protein